MRPAADTARREPARPGRGLADPIRSGRDALLASLERPLGAPRDPASAEPAAAAAAPAEPRRARGAAALIGAPASAFDVESDGPPGAEPPSVPSLAVLRPRHKAAAAEQSGDKPRKRLPSWDDVLFGSTPARESS
jgi:hypothetical protein